MLFGKTGTKGLRLLPVIVIMAMAIAVGAKNKWADEARVRKADYFYLEAQSREAEGDPDAAFELLNEAFRLNPADKTTGCDLGVYLLNLCEGDSAAFARAKKMIADYYEENPDDYYSTVVYGTLLDYTGESDKALKVWEDMHSRFPTNPQVTFTLAGSLAGTRDSSSVRRSIALYDTLELTQGFTPQMTMRKIQLLYMLGDTASIIGRIHGLLSAPGGRTSDNLVLAGNVFQGLELNDKALNCFQEACRADSTSGMAFYSLANYYLTLGDSIGYDREIYQALMRPSLEPEVKDALLSEFISSHLRDSLMDGRIEQLFGKVIDLHPHESAFHNSYSSWLSYKKRYAEAAEQMRYSVDLDPSDVKKWNALSQLYEVAKEYDKSIEAATDGLRYFPNEPELYYVRALDNVLLERNDSAIADLERALDVVKPADTGMKSSIYCTMADIWFKTDDPDKAFADYEQALLYNPDNALALNNYAYFLALSDRDLDKAQEMVEKALRIDPTNINAVDTYAWIMFIKKDYPRAREIFDSAIDTIFSESEISAEAYEHAGDIYFMTGDSEAAVKFWEEAYKINPDNDLLKKKVTHKTYFFK